PERTSASSPAASTGSSPRTAGRKSRGTSPAGSTASGWDPPRDGATAVDARRTQPSRLPAPWRTDRLGGQARRPDVHAPRLVVPGALLAAVGRLCALLGGERH